MSARIALGMATLLLLGTATAACSGKDQGEERAAPGGGGTSTAGDWAGLNGFTRVGASGPDKVVIRKGAAFSIKAEGDPEAVSDLRMKVDDGTLEIDRKSDKAFWSGSKSKGVATITVTLPALDGIDLAGSGDVDADAVSGDDVDLSLAGSGDMRVAMVQVGKLGVSIAGSGTVTLAGAAKAVDFSIAGSGDVAAQGLKAGEGEVSIAGSGNALFASDGKIDISLIGSGDVTVKGKAQCETSAIGSGKAHCGG